MADFFIRRPIVAIVIAIVTVIMGLFTLKGLSIEQYPFLAPPTIRVTATYPGASAVAVEQSVATPVEQEVNRSEEHTSELQSQSNLVCRLLLEKKKQTPFRTHHTPVPSSPHRHQCHAL